MGRAGRIGAGSKRRAGALARLFADEAGATAIEYALIAALLSMSIVAGATTVGGELTKLFDKIATGWPSP
jgi:pilus assembly protein Flp/PilA